jgi:transcriptional regulator with XRE-family HTH domain
MSWLGTRLNDLLSERGLSIQKVATELAIERAYLSLIVHGLRTPSEDLTRKLAAYFGEDEEEWAFRTKAQPVMDEFRRKYPNMWPKYARNVTDNRDKPPHEFSAPGYLSYNALDHVSEQAVTEFLPIQRIERLASEALKAFADRIGVDVDDLRYPLDAELLVRTVFDLDVHYDGEGVLDSIDSSLLGCLYAEGDESPWGVDRLVVVNSSQRYEAVTDNFTILHEAGHYVFHRPLDALAPTPNAILYCRSGDRVSVAKAKVDPREWQASRFASEVLMPKKKVAWFLHDKEPPAVVNLNEHGRAFRGFFGVSQAAMEKRLYDLGYRCAFGRYAYANITGVPTKRGRRRD